MSDVTQPVLTLVIEVPAIAALCDGDKDKFATKFGQIAQGVLFEATASVAGIGQAEMESLYTTSRGTISTNKKMLKECGAAWAVVEGQKLQALMGGEYASDTASSDHLSDATMGTVTALEQAAAQPEAAAEAPPAQDTNVVPLQPAGATDQAVAQVPAQTLDPNVAAEQPPAAAQPAQPMQPPAPAAQPVQPMQPPAPVAAFDVRTIDPTLANYMQTAPHPQGDPAHNVVAGEVMYWQQNAAAPQGGTWLTRLQAYQAVGLVPAEQAPAAPMGQPELGIPTGPGQPAIGQPVGPQGQAVQRVQPTNGIPHQ